MRRALARAAFCRSLLVLSALALDCNRYPLPPTDCDDRCAAVQRFGCRDDDPVDCVQACEAERAARTARGCVAEFDDETACLRAAPAEEFACEGDATQPTGACVAERRAFSACMAPAGGPCFDLCQQNAATCGSPLHDCESACLGLEPSCEGVADAYYACALATPVVCGTNGTAGAAGAGDGSGDQSPCYDAALEFLHCVGY